MTALSIPLPAWITQDDQTHFSIDGDMYYNAIFPELKRFAEQEVERLVEAGIEPDTTGNTVEGNITKSASDAAILAGCLELSACIVFETDEETQEKRLLTDKLTKYCLEVAINCLKLDFDVMLIMSGRHPRNSGQTPERRIKVADKVAGLWTVKTHPQGRGDFSATKGREGREIYRRMRGVMPH